MKQRIYASALFVLLAVLACSPPSHAQAPATVRLCNGTQPNCPLVGPGNPLPVSGSITANLGGFNAESNLTPFTATTGGVASGSFTAGKTIVVSNVGTTNTAYCKLGAASTTSGQPILPGSWFAFTSIAETQVACATSTSTTLVNVAVGTGLPTGAGGGGGSGGGGGAITAALGSYAAGALSAGAFATGAGVDGWDITQGAKADAAWTSGSGSVIALLKSIATNVQSPIPACASSPCTNVIGAEVIYQGTSALSATNGIYSNMLQSNAVLSQTNPIFASITDGTNKAAVKAASTAPLVTDPSLVTVNSPAIAATPIAAAASDNHATLKNGAGVAMSFTTSNNSATKNYARLYDAGTGFNGCNSATGLIFAMEIPPNDGGFNVPLGGGSGIAFTNGLSICITSGFGFTDTTNATASAIYANVSYK